MALHMVEHDTEDAKGGSMKIGNLQFKEYAAKKPLSISPTGKMLTASEIASQPALSLTSNFTLEPDQQLELALERYALEPDFKLGIIGAGLLTKDEVMDHLKQKTPFGRMALRAEMGYVNELIGQLAGGSVPHWPKTPKKPFPPFPDWRRRGKCVYLKLTNQALFCENTTDAVTTPFANYRIANVHPVFQARGFGVIVLQGVEDVRANFVPKAKGALTVYIGGIGHGNYDVYTGHWGDHILHIGDYDATEVKGKAIHFLSCRTARDLGPDTVANAANCYTGYTENFVLVWDDGTTPAVNEFELFARSDSTFDLAMVNGATALEAHKATIQAFNAAIAEVPNTVAATWLAWDRDHFKLHGDGAAAIQPYRAVKICFPIPALEQEEALVKAGEMAEMPS
jgi:hypothetical protein